MPSLSSNRLAEWRLFIDGFHDGPTNMAVDEAMLFHHSLGDTPPTLRFYGWKPPALTVGRYQDLESGVNLDACSRHGIDLVRRPTGGRAVLHDDEVTFSVVVRESILPGSVLETCRIIGNGLLQGLRLLGVDASIHSARTSQGDSPACFDAPSSYEITSGGRKLVGSAQCRQRGCILQHGSIPLRFDNRLVADLLTPPGHNPTVLAGVLSRRAADLSRSLGWVPTRSQVVEALTRGFERALGLTFNEAGLTSDELDTVKKLVEEKYGQPGWNHGLWRQGRSEVTTAPPCLAP